MRTLAHAMTSVHGGGSGRLPPLDGASGGLSGQQGGLADLEIEVFKDMVRARHTPTVSCPWHNLAPIPLRDTLHAALIEPLSPKCSDQDCSAWEQFMPWATLLRSMPP
jgi:hypothetical protein